MRIKGPTRLMIVISVAWVALVAFFTVDDFEAVNGGRSSTYGLSVLRDLKTGRSFGQLSKEEVQELGQLMAKEALLAGKTTKEAEDLIAASLSPALAWSKVAKWLVVPCGLLWTTYLSACWVRNGFRDPLDSKPPGMGRGSAAE